ncbi:DUF4282 domain-containing protein [Microbacterium halophytorum]|uniref:DUF4282 domain-containing protein n=1 Tax=Microbacterium halophytorum TaxID=2067568 RepID=UPI000CFBB1E1|nr:DUF4282 domain-containing protein [Microbacterium halophytorum]
MSNDNQNGDRPQQPGGQAPQPGGPAPQPGAHPPQPGAAWQQPPAPQPGQQPYGGYPQGQGANGDPGFFKALFDVSFRNYVTLKFAKVIFIILIVLAILGWLTAITAGFTVDPIVGVLAILFGWIGPFIALVIYRVLLEAAVALIRTAQNTSILVERR